MSVDGFDLQSFAQALSVPTQEALSALPHFQRQAAAWQFALELLGSNNINCRFFGAHTLHDKIVRDWGTLDASRRAGLRGELLRVVVEQSDGPLNVLSKVNQALVAYALHTVPDQWSGFLGSAIEAIQLGAQQTGKSRESAGHAIVDLLELFPEEVNRTVAGQAQRNGLIQDVKESLPLALELLTGVVCGASGLAAVPESAAEFGRLVGQSAAWRTRGWKAILQWLQFGVAGDTQLVPLLDMSLRQLEGMGRAQCSSAGAVDDGELRAAAAVVDDIVSNTRTAAQYTRSVGTLALSRFGQSWVSDVLRHCCCGVGDGQAALVWGSVLVSFGETYTEFILEKTGDAQLGPHANTFLQLMLGLTQFPGHHGFSEEVSDQPLNFWYLLQEALADSEKPSGATQIKAAYASLVRALVGKSAFPPADAWLDGDRDERDRFGAYRREVGDALLNAYYVLRSDMLGVLVDEAVRSMDGFSLDKWQDAEAVLFALRSIGEAVPEAESEHLPRLFSADVLSRQLLPVLQAELPSEADCGMHWGLTATKAAVLGVIGAYGDWWRAHSELLPLVVPCVTSCLGHSALVAAAVSAFRRICDSCRDQLSTAAENMVQLACEVVLAGAAVPAREQQRIVESVAEVLMALPPPAHTAALEPLVGALADRLDASLALLEEAPPGLGLPDAEPYAEPLAMHLRLTEALGRGLQFSDDAEERALLGDADDAAALAAAAQCYSASPAMASFRHRLTGVLERVFAARVWQRAAPDGMVAVDDALLECLLAVVNSTARRGPHVLAMDFAKRVAFVANAWAAVIARLTPDYQTVFGRRWADQCPAFLQCISQMVAVFSAPVSDWQRLYKPATDETDSMLAALLTRAVDDVCAAIARDAPTLAVAIEQQPVVCEYVFDLCTRVLQVRPEIMVCMPPSAVSRMCELSIHALSVANRLALRPTAHFLTALIRLSAASTSTANPSPVSSLLQALWTQHGLAWLRATLAAIGGMHPRSLLPNLAELLFAMVRNHPESVRAWMSDLFVHPSFPSAFVDDAAKRQFAQHVLATRSMVRVKTVVTDFSIKCRNLQGTYVS
ncbi:hypothetical protein GGI20_004078 [Coemansia sp. BCRC 34301]|nr:hypothetical protein GGI20_004078 [Coemansia sp. BCRC 34301]